MSTPHPISVLRIQRSLIATKSLELLDHARPCPLRRDMPHDTTLIGTVVAGLGVAFLMGALAHRLRISPIAGYLLAGVLVGPFTPGIVADTGLPLRLPEIGVLLLMFGVGLPFSFKDLSTEERR